MVSWQDDGFDRLPEWSYNAGPIKDVIRHPIRVREPHRRIDGGSGAPVDYGAVLVRSDRLLRPCCQALFPVVGDGTVNNCAAIDALPGVENEKKI